MSRETFVFMWIATISIWEGIVFTHFARDPKPQMASALTVFGWLSIPGLLGFVVLIALAVLPAGIVKSVVWQWGTMATEIALILGVVLLAIEGILLAKARARRN